MSLAIKWGDSNRQDKPSGFIYLSAVTSYTQDYRGQVTKHPVDAGASITDHFVKENSVYNISGVVSGADISYIPFSVAYEFFGGQPGNTLIQPAEINITEEGSGLLKYLPGSVGQFLTPSLPTVQMFGESRVDFFVEELTRDQLTYLMEGVTYDPIKDKVVSNVQLVSLYEFDGISLRYIIPRLVITNLRIREDSTTGNALHLDLTLEQVTFALLEKTEIPKDVADAVKKKAEPVKKKTNANSTPKNCADAQAAGDSTAPSTPAKQLSADDADKFGTD